MYQTQKLAVALAMVAFRRAKGVDTKRKKSFEGKDITRKLLGEKNDSLDYHWSFGTIVESEQVH